MHCSKWLKPCSAYSATAGCRALFYARASPSHAIHDMPRPIGGQVACVRRLSGGPTLRSHACQRREQPPPRVCQAHSRVSRGLEVCLHHRVIAMSAQSLLWPRRPVTDTL